MPGAERAELVAFYGTLMSGFEWQERLGVGAQLRLVGPCRIPGVLFDLGEWPTLVEREGVVEGELFEVLDARIFAELDPFEDYDPRDPDASRYLRVSRRLIEPDVEAWVYVANEPVDPAREIPSGSWYEWVTHGRGT